MAKGWYNEPVPHGMAARGISTGRKHRKHSKFANTKSETTFEHVAEKNPSSDEVAEYHKREMFGCLKKSDWDGYRYHRVEYLKARHAATNEKRKAFARRAAYGKE